MDGVLKQLSDNTKPFSLMVTTLLVEASRCFKVHICKVDHRIFIWHMDRNLVALQFEKEKLQCEGDE